MKGSKSPGKPNSKPVSPMGSTKSGGGMKKAGTGHGVHGPKGMKTGAHSKGPGR